MKKRTVALLLACVLVVGAAVGGTLAWLMSSSGPVTNTFTVGDINITLQEHTVDENGALTTTETSSQSYSFIPGATLNKDPFVTVEANSEACYLFVKVTEVNNTMGVPAEQIIEWAPAEGWTAYPVDSVTYYYRTVTKSTADQDFYILAGNTVTVNENVTKDMVSDLQAEEPQLVFHAAAVQMNYLVVPDGSTELATAFELSGIAN